MAFEAPASADRPEISPWFRRFSAWVSRVGAGRATLLASACASLGSLALTWLCLRLLGHHAMGNAFWISLVVPVPLSLVFGGVNFFLVAELESAWGKVHGLAMVDALTGLHNRRHFMSAAQRELDLAQRHRQPLALLVLDVDHFKAINDVHGHLAGDQVLVEIGKRCQQTLRATDLLTRWGGEEFIVLLPNTPVVQARQLAERMREAVSASAQLMVNGHAAHVTVSIGAAGVAAGQAMALGALIQLADRALYQAKHAGRDRVSMSGHDDIDASGKKSADGKLAVLET